MKQQLWILNSSLLIIFIFTLLLNIILKEEKVVLKGKSIDKEKLEKKEQELKVLNPEKIYQKDLFGTYFFESTPEPEKKELITPIPEYVPAQIILPPEPEKPTFIEPLNLKLSGIISSSNEEKSIAMILDETNKENVYHLGNMFKDGQIIKISKNRVILLRTNGQQEIYLLREEEIAQKTIPDLWEYIIKKNDDNNFIVDPKSFSKKINTLGAAIEKLALIPAYSNNKLIGLKIGQSNNQDIINIMGLRKDDVILSINNISTSNTKNRINIFDKISQSKINDIIKVNLKRNEDLLTLNYTIQNIEKPRKQFFTGSVQQDTKQEQTTIKELPMSRDQEREKQIREFEKEHKTPKQEDIITEIRKRILNSMNARSMENRIR
ncbi:MAG: hypothetical protein SZ59_C0002G0110 [candidate division TM6 bacterium GW2011_GWF2_28_16]|nr:MAG: hypothetical protein SZ59_C0002G0110 [candidate division TM6 bacterium GW2011_GWF2_28_16]